jgi:MYXO-CTERM domain-containing protein
MADARLEHVESLLADQGHDLAGGRVRVAVGRSGVAIGFPQLPLIHVSWWALAGVALAVGVRRRYRRR